MQAFQDLSQGLKYHRELKHYDSAYVYLLRAAHQYQEAGQWERHAYAQLRCAFSAHRGNKHQLAESHYQKSLETYESIYPTDNLKIADPCMGLGSLYAVTGNYYLALSYTLRSLAIKQDFLGEEHIDTGVNHYNAGTAYMNYGEYENAMDAYQKALPIYLNHHGEDHQRVSSLYVNMGILYDKRGESEKALEYYLRSVEIDRKLYGDDFYLLAYNYYNMAISYMNLHQNALAETYYHKTIEQSRPNQLHQLLAVSHYGLGNVESERGHYEAAINLYQQSIDLFLEHFGKDFPGLNHAYRAMAVALAQQGAYQRSIEYLEQTLELLSRNFGAQHPFIGAAYQEMATVYQKQGQFQKALNAIEQGYAALKKETLEGVKFTSPEAYLDPQVLLDLVREEAKILNAQYQATKDLHHLELALNTLQRAIEFIDQIRKGYLLDDSKLLLQEEATTTFEQAISTSLALFRQTGEEDYLENMFEFMEKSKATLLSETLQSNALSNIQGIPDSVLVEEKTTRRKISFVEGLLNTSENNTDSIRNELFMLKRNYDTLAEHIAQKYPKYYQLKYQVNTKSLDEVKQMLDPAQAVITYFLGNENWYTLSISRDKIGVNRIDSSKIKELDLKRFRQMVSDAQQDWDSQLAHGLFHELVAKPLQALGTINRLIIVPDGALGHIPFDAMMVSSNVGRLSKQDFALNRYAVSYAPSITMLGLSDPIHPSSKSYYGFAPVDYQDLAPLLGSLDEVNRASDLLNGKAYLHQEATESNLKKIEFCGVVHLAMHALIDDQDPMRSRLIFSNANDSLDDGNLYASEIYNLKLYSNLSILSSCNTGIGSIIRGEGIMNLSRAFQYAGSPNIVMSLWQASDASTTDIIYQFLSHLKAGLSKDQALRQAKLSYLQKADPLQAHPAFWATFVFMGDPSPLQFGNYLWRWLALITLFLLALFWLLRVKV